MLFTGDVAIGQGDRFVFENFPGALMERYWCLNLEGAISEPPVDSFWGVYNSVEWNHSFSKFKLAPLFIGNNHIQDISDGINLTQSRLSELGLSAFGAGVNSLEAEVRARVVDGQRAYIILGFGWHVIGCKSAGRESAGVNALVKSSVLRQVTETLQAAGEARVVVVFHGNYEFELYPQPAHRRLSMDLIDLGVYAVVGHHPHVVGPVELYKGRTIAYSLGNWAFSRGHFFNGKLKFPVSSYHQVALELGEDGDVVHHAEFAPPSKVIWRSSEAINSNEFSLRPVFEGFSDDEYLTWFNRNRVKRKGLPVYKVKDSLLTTWSKDGWVAARQVLVDIAAKFGIKAMRRSA